MVLPDPRPSNFSTILSQISTPESTSSFLLPPSSQSRAEVSSSILAVFASPSPLHCKFLYHVLCPVSFSSSLSLTIWRSLFVYVSSSTSTSPHSHQQQQTPLQQHRPSRPSPLHLTAANHLFLRSAFLPSDSTSPSTIPQVSIPLPSSPPFCDLSLHTYLSSKAHCYEEH